MPGIGFSFQDTEPRDSSSSRTAVVIALIVVAATVGVVLLLRAYGQAAATGNEPAGQPAAEKPSSTQPAQTPSAKPTPAPKPTSDTARPTPPPPPKQEIAPAAPPASASDAEKAAAEAEAADDFATARAKYLEALSATKDDAERARIEERLGAIDIALIFSQRMMDGKSDYAIASGDSIGSIARKFGTTVDLIVKANGIANPNRIQAGYRLRLLDKRVFAITVSKSRNDLLVTLDGKFFKRYRVGTGRFAKTPNGTFRVSDKIPEPPWWRPDGKVIPYGDKENILGTRWMAVEPTGDTGPARGYGIHGTWDDASIGSQSSAGCVRMHNADVEELFTYIPVGTSVLIEE